MRSLPKELGGIVFLSGGLPEEAATVYLNAMQKVDRSTTFEKRENGIYHSPLVVLYNTLLLKHGVVRILRQVKQH